MGQVYLEFWQLRSRGSTLRSVSRPLGRKDSQAVRDGNILTARALILVILAACKACFWILEQPSTSIMHLHPLFQYCVRRIGVERLMIAMGDYGAPTPKRTILFTGRSRLVELNLLLFLHSAMFARYYWKRRNTLLPWKVMVAACKTSRSLHRSRNTKSERWLCATQTVKGKTEFMEANISRAAKATLEDLEWPCRR